MSTVVYLANQQVQVVTGQTGNKKVSVSKTYNAVAPEGSIINGLIMDADAFIEFMKDFWRSNGLPTKDVFLVVNSNKFVGKVLEAPALKDSKLFEFIDREFADIRKSEEDIYGFITLSGTEKKNRRIYAESITPDFIQDYVDIFSAIGVNIKALYSGESSLIGLAAITVASEYKTFVLEIAEGMTLSMLLFVNGEFSYFNMIRCFNERGTEAYAMDVARSISQISQFMQAHQIEFPLESITLAGFEESDADLYRSAIMQQGISVPVSMFDARPLSGSKEDVKDYIHAASGLINAGKPHNFLNQFHGKKKKSTQSASAKKAYLMVGITAAVMLALVGVSFVMQKLKKNELQELKDYYEGPLVTSQLEEYDELSERNSFLLNQSDAIAAIDENMHTYPICDSGVVSVFEKCAVGYVEMEFESFDAVEGIATVVVTSDDVDDINKYIAKLMEQDIFYQVDYTGYTYNDEKQKWDVHVTCTFAEAAGR